MSKIYYNNDGIICDRYPLNIEIDESCRFIEVEENEDPTSICSEGYVWAVKDGKPTLIKHETMHWTILDRYNERVNLHMRTDTDYAKYSRQVRMNIDKEHSQAILDYIDEYNLEVSNTVNQAGFPQEVVYPEYKLP